MAATAMSQPHEPAMETPLSVAFRSDGDELSLATPTRRLAIRVKTPESAVPVTASVLRGLSAFNPRVVTEGYEPFRNLVIVQLDQADVVPVALVNLREWLRGEEGGRVDAIFPIYQCAPGFDSALTPRLEVTTALGTPPPLPHGIKVVAEYVFQEAQRIVSICEVAPDAGLSSLDAAAALSMEQGVLAVAPEFLPLYETFASDDPAVPNDPLFTGGEGEYLQTNFAINNVWRAWNISTGNPRVTVAVLDSGIYYRHPDFWLGHEATPENALGKIWTDQDCHDGMDGDGFPCGKHGYDFNDGDGDPNDESDVGHGTKSAGLIGALRNNGRGIAGIAGGDGTPGNPGVKLLPVRVAGRLFSDKPGQLSWPRQIADGLRYVARKQARDASIRIVNMSLHFTDPSPLINEAIRECNAKGITLIGCAGNFSMAEESFPCRYPEVICVGSLLYHGHQLSQEWTRQAELPDLPCCDPASADYPCTGEDERRCEEYAPPFNTCEPCCFEPGGCPSDYPGLPCGACMYAPTQEATPAMDRAPGWMDKLELRRAYNFLPNTHPGGIYPAGSNYGNRLDLMAAGMMNFSTTDKVDVPGRLYSIFGATSSCSPQAAGVAALLLDVQPDLQPHEIIALLAASATDLRYEDHPWFFNYSVIETLPQGLPPELQLPCAGAGVCDELTLAAWHARVARFLTQHRAEPDFCAQWPSLCPGGAPAKSPAEIYNPRLPEYAGPGRDRFTGFGLLDAYAAIQWASDRTVLASDSQNVATVSVFQPEDDALPMRAVLAVKGRVHDHAGVALPMTDEVGNLYLPGALLECGGPEEANLGTRDLAVAFDAEGNLHLDGLLLEGARPDPDATRDRYLIFDSFEEAGGAGWTREVSPLAHQDLLEYTAALSAGGAGTGAPLTFQNSEFYLYLHPHLAYTGDHEGYLPYRYTLSAFAPPATRFQIEFPDAPLAPVFITSTPAGASPGTEVSGFRDSGGQESNPLALDLAHWEQLADGRVEVSARALEYERLLMKGLLQGPNHFIAIPTASGAAAVLKYSLDSPAPSSRGFSAGLHFKAPAGNAAFRVALSASAGGEATWVELRQETLHPGTPQQEAATVITGPMEQQARYTRKATGNVPEGSTVVTALNSLPYEKLDAAWYEVLCHWNNTPEGSHLRVHARMTELSPWPMQADFDLPQHLPADISGFQVEVLEAGVEGESLYLDNLFLYARNSPQP